LDDLAVTPYRAIQTLQITVDDKNQVIELLAACQRNGAERFRLVGFAVTQEAPDSLLAGRNQAAMLQILHEAGLVNGLNGAKRHGNGRELPEIRHQPGVRI